MNKMKFFGESLLAMVAITGLSIAVTSGYSNAKSVATPATQSVAVLATPAATNSTPLASLSNTSFNGAAGEGMGTLHPEPVIAR